MSLPVGSVVASVLTLQDFKRLMPQTEVWELADGQKLANNSALSRIIAVGGEYSTLNPGNIPVKPNLNGAFLRGRDYESDPLKIRNPDGKVNVGTFQGDELGRHRHDHPRPGGDDGSREGGGRDGWYGHSNNQVEPTGGAETRPRNVTVNFFIRTN